MMDKIFKAYDIRGVYPDELNEETAYMVGRSFPLFLDKNNPTIVIGKDGRNSSRSLFDNLKKGLFEAGATVIDIQTSTTPLLSFTVCKNNYDGGVMITASHNPPQFNGFKLIKKRGFQVCEDEIKKIKSIIDSNDFSKNIKKGEIKNFSEQALKDYLFHIKSFVDLSKKLKVIIDYANGSASLTGKPFFKNTSLDIISLFDDIDGNFPNHLANPAEIKNMKTLIKRVKQEKADIGIFFDGDGDRAFFIDENGDVIYPDLLLSALVENELSKNKNEKIYFDLRFSKITKEMIKKAEGIPIMMRVGNPFYKEKLITEGGLIGSELSGHFMHKDNFYIDDGLFVAVKIINFLSKNDKKLSEIIKPLKKYYQSEEINIEVLEKDAVLDNVKKYFSDGKSYDIDGVYIEFSDWWFSLRKSNTEDLVRLRLEADSKDILEEKKKKIINMINNF